MLRRSSSLIALPAVLLLLLVALPGSVMGIAHRGVPLVSASEGREPTGSSWAIAAARSRQAEPVSQFDSTTNAVAVRGSFAYVGIGQRLVILDISSPTIPTLVGQSNPLPERAQGITVDGHYAYVSAGTAGLHVFDVANPGDPTEVSVLASISAQGVAIVGSYAYVVGDRLWDLDSQQYMQAALRVVDISDPAHPTQRGFVAMNHVSFPSPPWRVAVAGDYAYVAAGFLIPVDVSNPAAPTLPTLDYAPAAAWDVAIVGSYAYVASYADGLSIVDLSNRSHPAVVGSLKTSSSALAIGVTDDHAYIALDQDWLGDHRGGLATVDVSNPASPLAVGQFKTPGSAVGVALEGHYTYLAVGDPGENVADAQSGLHIVDVSDPANPTQIGAYYPSSAEYRAYLPVVFRDR